ncbi:MAG: hypothetical protein ACOX68_08855 [Candidatus Limivicinus sp.]|jgi:hypothetical protein
MWKRYAVLLLALLMTGTANMHFCCSVTVNGERLEGLYSPETVRRAGLAAERTAEEILPGESPAPEIRKLCRLSLRPPEGELPVLTDKILRSEPEIISAVAVRTSEGNLGCVDSRAIFLERLHRHIFTTLPDSASGVRLGGELEFERVYTGSGRRLDYSPMVHCLTDTLPLIYSA